MAPKNLLKSVFHNIYRQKSLDAIKARRAERARSKTRSPASQSEQPQPAPLASPRKSVHHTEESSLCQIEEEVVEEVRSTDSTLEVIEEVSSPWCAQSNLRTRLMRVKGSGSDDSYSDSHGPGLYNQFYNQALATTTSHLDTIETALVLLKALEYMSPHVEGMKREMLDKKTECEKALKALKVMWFHGEMDDDQTGNDKLVEQMQEQENVSV
jgi:hypothetical protein